MTPNSHLKEAPQQAASRLGQEYGLAERAAEFVHGRLQDHPEGDSRHEHWREVIEIARRPASVRWSAATCCASGSNLTLGTLFWRRR